MDKWPAQKSLKKHVNKFLWRHTPTKPPPYFSTPSYNTLPATGCLQLPLIFQSNNLVLSTSSNGNFLLLSSWLTTSTLPNPTCTSLTSSSKNSHMADLTLLLVSLLLNRCHGSSHSARPQSWALFSFWATFFPSKRSSPLQTKAPKCLSPAGSLCWGPELSTWHLYLDVS